MVTTDNLATITTAGYLNNIDLSVFPIYASDRISCLYSYNEQTKSGILADFTVSITNGVIILVIFVNPGNVLLPVVSGNFPSFNGTSGQIKDSGISASNPLKSKVASINNTTTVNHIATYTDANGTIGEDPVTAINSGSIQAGMSGIAGSLISFPTAANTGSIQIIPNSNSGNFTTVITNQAMGQTSTIAMPDPGAASAKFILDSASNQMVAGSRLLLAKVTGTEAANAITLNGQAGVITTSALTTAGGARYTFTWTNSFISANSVVLLSWMRGTNSKDNITFTVEPTGGSASVNIFNNGVDALDGTIIIGFAIF
jgi:hypothetical protein